MGTHSKIAIFHPWIKSRGGSEKVLLELLKNSKHKFGIYTWAYDKEKTFSEFKNYKINLLLPKIGKKLSRLFILRGLFLPLGLLKKIPLEKYDKFFIFTSGVAEFITFRNYKKNQTYAYVYTPLREANKKIIKWNLENRYNSFIRKEIYLIAVKIYKFFEKKAWNKLGEVIFISKLSASRAKENGLLKNKKEIIIYPPVDLEKFKNLDGKEGKNFVYFSRLNPPKRQDILIKAWKNFSKKNKGYKLIIIGTPDNKKYYKKILKLSKNMDTVKIKINVSDKELKKNLLFAKAGIFLGYQEDFGIVPLEIIGAGNPLLAVDEGGYVDLIKNNPLFYPIKEKHLEKDMVQEVSKALENLAIKKNVKKNVKKIKLNDFIREIDKFLEK